MKSKIPTFDAVQGRLLSRKLEAHVNRLYAAISHNAEERYREFPRACPGSYGRVPLHMIASCLGVSRETLSRIRKHASGQSAALIATSGCARELFNRNEWSSHFVTNFLA